MPSPVSLWQGQEDIQKPRELWSAETGNWIPSLYSTEAIGVATWIASSGNLSCFSKSIHIPWQPDITHISKSMWVLIQSRVYEPNCGLACSETFLVDQVDDGGKNGCRSTGTADKGWLAGDVEKDVQTDSRDVRVSAARFIVIRVSIGGQVVRRWSVFEVAR